MAFTMPNGKKKKKSDIIAPLSQVKVVIPNNFIEDTYDILPKKERFSKIKQKIKRK